MNKSTSKGLDEWLKNLPVVDGEAEAVGRGDLKGQVLGQDTERAAESQLDDQARAASLCGSW